MTTRESKLVFSEAGSQQVRGRVISLNEALEAQKRKHDELARLLPKTQTGLGVVGSVAQSSAAKVTSLTNTVGPLGAGLGALTRAVNPATTGLLAWASAAEKVSLVNRLMNATLLAGVTGVVAAGATVVAYGDDLLRAADTYSTLTARIRTFSDGQIAAAQTERQLYETGKDARIGVGDLTTLYTRLTPAVQDYGRAQQDALTITELTSKALAIQGVDVREQAAATVQFSQAIASGVLRGDELRSLLESSPQLLRYIAKNLEINGKVGTAFSSLRKLGEAGALTTDKIIDALLRAQPQIERDFINAPKTAQQGWIVLKDEIVRSVGSIDKVVGGQKAVVDWLGQMATKAEEFRKKMVADPHAFDGLKQAADFVGGAVGSIGTLGKVAVDNFDAIVSAGQALLALKVGSVIATWFAQAASASKAAIGNLQEFQRTAQFQAGAQQAPVLAQSATVARSAAIAADTVATEKMAAAELANARALAVRSAADKAAATADAARRLEAEAQARAQAALARVERESGRDIAAAQRLKGEAAEIRARLEEDAARRSAAAAKSADAAAASSGLSKAGIGPAGAYYAKQAQADATAAMLLTDEQRQAQLARLREIEVAEARAAATVAAAEQRKAVAVVTAEAEIANARTASLGAATAQAEASALVTAAERAEAQAMGANVAATNAVAAASTRNAVAQEAEALVTDQVTRKMVVKSTTMKAMEGLYNLLGGGIGLATIAIGGLIYALYKSEEAYRKQLDAQRESILVNDQLKALTNEMTGATWAQIPALEAQTDALLRSAEAEREKAKATIARKQAELDRYNGKPGQVVGGDFAEGGAMNAGRLRSEIKDQADIVAKATSDAWKNRQELVRQDLVKANIQAQTIQRQLSSGKDLAGRALTDQQKSDLDAQLTGLFQKGQKAVDDWDARLKRQQSVTEKAQGGAKAGAAEVQGIYAGIFDTAAQLVTSATKSSATPPKPTTKPKKVAVPGGVSAAYDDLLKAGFLDLTGGNRYAAKDGNVTRDGKELVARSEDEAAAMAKYLKAVEAVNSATDAQLKKKAQQLGVSVKSREELKLAAGAVLNQELETSKAARADERWQDMKAEMEGTTRSQIKAENDLAAVIRDGGVNALDPMVARYRQYIAVQKQTADLQRGLQATQPVVQRSFDRALTGSSVPVDSRGLVDEAAAVRRIEQAKAAVILDENRAVEERLAELRRTGDVTEFNEAKQREDLHNAYRVQVEIQTQEQILEIRRERLRQSWEATEQQARDSADAIVGALKDASFGGDIAEVGKRLGTDLLSAFYDELLGNPLRLAIQTTIRDLVNTRSGGTSGLFGTIINAGLGAFGHANLDSTVSATIAKNPNLFADGRIPAFADGRAPWMDGPFVKGPGTPRSDRTPAWVSPDEAIINALSSKRYQRELKAINDGTYDPHAQLRRLMDRTGLGGGHYANGYIPGVDATPTMPATSVSRREGDVILNNMSGSNLTANRRTDEKGNLHIDLRQVMDQGVKSAGRSGALKRGLDQSPQPIKRG